MIQECPRALSQLSYAAHNYAKRQAVKHEITPNKQEWRGGLSAAKEGRQNEMSTQCYFLSILIKLNSSAIYINHMFKSHQSLIISSYQFFLPFLFASNPIF